MSRLTDLPAELILATILHLAVADIRSVFLVCNRRLTSICQSPEVQLRVEQERAGVEENGVVARKETTARKREMLAARERRLYAMDFVVQHTIPAPPGSTLYDSAGDFFAVACGTPAELKSLRKLVLTEKHEWTPIYEAPARTRIMSFELAVLEHDLVAIITSTTDEDDPDDCEIGVQLIRYSSGEPYHLARKPYIRLLRCPVDAVLDIDVEIMGESLGVCLLFPENDPDQYEDPEERFLYIYNWKTGVSLPGGPLMPKSFGFQFLTPNIILTSPKNFQPCIDVFFLVEPHSNGSRRIRFLLPDIVPFPEAAFHDIEFSRQGKAAVPDQLFSRSLFHPVANDNLVVVYFRSTPRDYRTSRFCRLIIHRAPFMAAIDAAAPWFVRNQHNLIKWEDWGEKYARLIHSSDVPLNYNGVFGQRVISTDLNSHLEPSPLHILDFNPGTVRRFARAASEQEPEDADGAGCTVRVVQSRETPNLETDIAYVAMNEGQLRSDVSYVHFVSKKMYAYNAVHMNNESLVGVKFNDTGLESLEVLRFAAEHN